MTQGKGSKRRPSAVDDATYAENYSRIFKGPERIDRIIVRGVTQLSPEMQQRMEGVTEFVDVPMTRVRVPMPTQSGVPLMAQNDDPPYPRITPRKELDDPYA